MNQFGGDWTKIKIEILVEYAKAYLTIMNTYAKRFNWKLLYFDGFAGSGEIIKVIDDKMTLYYDVDYIIGAAVRIIQTSKIQYHLMNIILLKKMKKIIRSLLKKLRKLFRKKNFYCHKKIVIKNFIDLSNYLRNPKNKNYRTLAFIDPCGML
ncbi:MAG: three-Cys-motif partner protein TcmP [Chitinophagaceae bacterium]